MDANALHLAMAALVGASFVAVSAYYMHRKTLTQLLEFAKSVEREREENNISNAELPQRIKGFASRPAQAKRKGNWRSSASLPDVTSISCPAIDDDYWRNGTLPVDGIPPELPRLHTLLEGTALRIFLLK